jgi:hypothetical protein
MADTRSLTRRRNPDALQETWMVQHKDVRVGTIAIRSGIPPDEDPWGWNCGFYPGSEPREHLSGTAKTLEEARADFEPHGASFPPNEPRPIIRPGATSTTARRGNTPCGMRA